MRQVAHALLTRPPLSHITRHPEGIRDQASFDLHVLSTPPAFILSQDQTLMLNGLSQVKKALASYPCSLLFYKERSSVFLKKPSWKIHRNFQGCLIVQLSIFILPLCRSTQLLYFIISKFVCQELFSRFFLSFWSISVSNFYRISCLSDFVKHFFCSFLSFRWPVLTSIREATFV